MQPVSHEKRESERERERTCAHVVNKIYWNPMTYDYVTVSITKL